MRLSVFSNKPITSRDSRTLSAIGQGRVHRWLKRLGLAGFLFFLIKGLLWLIIPALLVNFGIRN